MTHRPNSKPLIYALLLGLSLSPLACADLPSDPGDAETRASVISAAVEDYFICADEDAELQVCEAEELLLIDALYETEAAEQGFRATASVTVDCPGGTSLTCEGHICAGSDNSGCFCVMVNQTVESKSCKDKAKPMM